MAAETLWAVIVAVAVATQATRLSFLAWGAHIELPRLLQRGLAYLPAAILAAIIAPQVFTGAGPADLPWPDPARLTAAVAAFAIALTTRSTLLTVFLGMGVFWGAQALLGH